MVDHLDSLAGFEITIEGEGSPDRFHSKQPCPHCGRLFRTKSGLLGHIAAKHKEAKE